MSHYTIPGTNLLYTIVYGWDQGLQTYFAHVYDMTHPMGEDHTVVWMGTAPHEIRTVEQLQFRLRNYVRLTQDQCAALQRDYDTREPLTPLQQWTLEWLMQEVRA